MLAAALASGCGGHERVSAACHVTAYFAEGTRPADVRRELRQLLADDRVASVTFVSKEQALREMRKKFPDLVPQTLAMNPLPDALVVRPNAAGDAAVLARELRHVKRVGHVSRPTRQCG